jgi:hypothetical protein
MTSLMKWIKWDINKFLVHGWKHEKISHKVCGQCLKIIFWIFEKSPWELIYQKNCSIFATTKFSWKFTMFQKSFYMLKALKKSMWTSGCFISIFLFSYEMFTKSFWFFVNFNTFHKKGSMCSKHSKNENTYSLLNFDIWTSLNIIIVLNL